MSECPILIASDLTARNDRAVDRAAMLARQLALPLALVHVRKGGAGDGRDSEEVLRLARAALPDPAVPAQIYLPSGSPPEAIVRTAQECDASLIVCAVARFNGLGDYLLGTSVDHVITRGHRPVLVVKQRPHQPYSRLLIAVDFSDHSAHALKVATQMFPQAEIEVLHAFQLAYDGIRADGKVREEAESHARAEMDRFLDQPELAPFKGRLRTAFAHGDIGAALEREIARFQPDLVVTGTHGRSGFKRAVLGSVASTMLEWVEQDMLIIPPRQG